MPTTQTRWVYILRLPDGHRLFLDAANNRVAIADRTGNNPDLTHDGPLFLDSKRPLSIVHFEGPLIPVCDEQGNPSVTPTDFETILHLSSAYGWDIHVGGSTCYKATKVAGA